ncbi:hypothetical protein E4H04_09325 [Candidatus Bathyarchaeota archaeon]|nr:MAG: hypothetical protein E4H04_09325 [Candidatus Bathyarchaeota archaeon]
MPYAQQCSRCKKLFTLDNKKRFCDNCGSILQTVYHEEDEPTKYPLDDERQKIATYIYEKYEEFRKDFGDLELDMLKQIKVDTIYDRFEIITLATLFSGYAMREERAYSIWSAITQYYRDSDTNLYDFLVGNIIPPTQNLRERFGVPPKVTSSIWQTARNLIQYNGDLNGLQYDGSWSKTIENIANQCKGINQKAFWIARVMRQKQAWDIPGQYCCVSDSHNKALLMKTGFIKSDTDLFYNSLVMWRFFNEPFKNKYYDLPITRYARSSGCKNCFQSNCNLETLSDCGCALACP